ncbi:MAG TPA: alanine--tRNA ligase [Vicinamibacterales bacterium]|nr:alanine--tRNA ligase [Vicinamibacterales bacterium]
MKAHDIRSSFLGFFEQHGHRIVPSSSLVPTDDPTLLFTNAGMNQFKDVFLGREKRDYTRAATCQKVMRVSGKHNDLDNVGPSHRHHTFFQMLGNFSFGDYFKADAIELAWTLLTKVWKMPPERLVVSVFKGEAGIPRDDEAYDIWRKLVPADRILELGLEDNFWQMGETGPCGRCSEIYYVRGGSGHDPEIEIWNNVFMEFERSAGGTLTPLPAPSIDTGMGFERIAAVLQGKESNYDTDLFTPILNRITDLTGVAYGPLSGRSTPLDTDVHMRVIADHIRAMTFLIADGVIPSNEWRGYVLRKIMRRAMRHGKHLSMREPFLHRIVDVIVDDMGDAYPELRTNREGVTRTILAEEHRFEAVLTDGLPRLEAEIAKVLNTPSSVLKGEVAFQLYDTFGVPYDFIEDTAATQGLTVDRAAFDRAMEGQRDKARAQSAFGGSKKSDDFNLTDDASLKNVGDQFEGYTATGVDDVPVVALFDEARQPVRELGPGSSGFAALERTPFYLESGGQVSDTGTLATAAAVAEVDGLARIRQGLPRVHHIKVASGTLHVDDRVAARVNAELRDATRRNHTATHLLHAALRQVLGAHVKQAGSLVAPDRLRFDFAHFQAVTPEELTRIERIVNEQVLRNTPVETEVRSTEDAIKAGAMALFGEKYGERVRVVSIPGFSMELCGGTHVRATGDIGLFTIVSEGGVASGVRRIEALTGMGAYEWARRQRASLQRVVETLHVNEDQATEAIEKLQAETKRLHREVTQLKTQAAMGGGSRGEADDSVEVNGIRLIRRKVSNLDKEALRGLTDSLKARVKSGVIVIGAQSDGKAQIVVSVTPDLTARIKAGQIVKELAPIVGGGGGGRPDFAEAGGKQPEKIDEMLAAAQHVLEQLLT